MAIKCNPENLPDDLLDNRFLTRLSEIGVDLWIDAPSQRDGADQHWHDFSSVDAVLCVRSSKVGREWLAGKPATRLINAWVAGCIPIATREPAYDELANHGTDVWFIDDLQELPLVLRELNESPETLRALEEGVLQKRAEFAPVRILGLWREMLLEMTASLRPSKRRVVRAYAAMIHTRADRSLEHIRAAVRAHLSKLAKGLSSTIARFRFKA
jgi:hypothetical protein